MKKHVILAVVCIIGLSILIFKPESKTMPYVGNESIVIEVEITGAVKKPGVYKVNPGTTLAYLIQVSGGLQETADISQIMLGTPVNDKHYFIPSHKEVKDIVVQKVNLNQVTYNELIKMDHITENRALEILLYKKNHGNFKRIE